MVVTISKTSLLFGIVVTNKVVIIIMVLFDMCRLSDEVS